MKITFLTKKDDWPLPQDNNHPRKDDTIDSMDILSIIFGKDKTENITLLPKIINPGEQFDLKKGERILLGRANFKVPGYTVYQIDGTDSNFSNYGVEIFYGSDGAIVVQKPNLQINGKQYLSSNTVAVSDTRSQWQEVERVYNAGLGINLNQIKVQGDDGSNFIVELVDGDTFKLLSLESI